VKEHVAVIGAGNIGSAIAKGLVTVGRFKAGQITLTRRKTHLLESFSQQGYVVHRDNREAVRESGIVIVAVEPRQIDGVLSEIAPALDPSRQLVISVVSGVRLDRIQQKVGGSIPVVRAMPNTAVAIGESITCLTSSDEKALSLARTLFDSVGRTLVIDEEQMIAATSLGACGIAFFLRAIRAASQGGIEIGFQSAEALLIAAQTARGAASLMLSHDNHPESEIDKVTTPRGCTISGLNQMEYEGFSSAMIKGIVTSAEKASKLYSPENGNTGNRD
jgi:pyrroline-5-carboxylate reductase